MLLNHRVKELKSRPQRRANTCSCGHRPWQHLCARGRRAAKRPQTSLLQLRAFLAEASALAKDMYLGNSQHLRKLHIFSRSWSLRPRIMHVGGIARGVIVEGKALLHLCSPVWQTLATCAHSNVNGLQWNQVRNWIPQLRYRISSAQEPRVVSGFSYWIQQMQTISIKAKSSGGRQCFRRVALKKILSISEV